MTIETTPIDPQCRNATALAVDGVCCAIAEYDADQDTPETECGIELTDRSPLDIAVETNPRAFYIEYGIEMCDDCWPASVVGNDDA